VAHRARAIFYNVGSVGNRACHCRAHVLMAV
jgi:hypothetical protein